MSAPDWDDLRIFLAVARAGRFIAAGQRLKLDHTTVSRRIGALERVLGSRLLERSPRGVALTSDGLRLLGHAERMEAEFASVRAQLGGMEQRLSGTVRLATPEAIGACIIAPNLGRLHAAHPNLELQLIPEARAFRPSEPEVDIVVSADRPGRGRLVTRKLADYSLGLFASAEYLQAHDPITSVADLERHSFVWFIDDLADAPEIVRLDQVVANAKVVFRSSSIVAQQNAVASGLGLGLLHRFVAQMDSRMAPVLPREVHCVLTYWASVRAVDRHAPRVRAVLDFLNEVSRLHRLDGELVWDSGPVKVAPARTPADA